MLTNQAPATAGSTSLNPAPILPVSRNEPPPTVDPTVAMASPDNNRLHVDLRRAPPRLAGGRGRGLAAVLILLALINIFLGMINLVPLPPFDGGHAAVATYEAIREQPQRSALPGRHGQADAGHLRGAGAHGLHLRRARRYLDLLHPVQNPYGMMPRRSTSCRP